MSNSEQLKVAIVSHAYLDPEVFKNLETLSSMTPVALVTPRKGYALGRPRRTAGLEPIRVEVHARRALQLRVGVFIFLVPWVRMPSDTQLIIVEYDPWLPAFWQVLFGRAICCRRASIILSTKKNTFRQRPAMRSSLKRFMARLGLKRTNGVIAASALAAEMFEAEFSLAQERIRVVPHLGVDESLFVPSGRGVSASGETLVVGFVGSISIRKGADVLLDAFRTLLEERSGINLVMVGDWDLPAEYGWARRNPAIEIRSPVESSDVWRCYAEMDVFVAPSRTLADHQEHDGRAVIEAMLSGLPVVATESGVFPDLLSGGRGVLVRDAVPNLVMDALRDLIDRPDARSDVARMGLEYARKHLTCQAVSAARLDAAARLAAVAEDSYPKARLK